MDPDQIARAMRWAFEHLKIAAEPSGAAALAALTGTGLPPGPAGVVISVLPGVQDADEGGVRGADVVVC